MIGQIIGGDYGEIEIRKRSDETIEIGELLVADTIMLQVFDVGYGSLLEKRDLARMSGMALEGYGDLTVKETNLRNYTEVRAKPVFDLLTRGIPKTLPEFFHNIRRVTETDFEFLRGSEDGMYLGEVRSGSRILNIPLYLRGEDLLTHHILIPATTGRGKSNFMKVMLWNLVGRHYAGILVLDAHDEYYSYTHNGRRYGLSEHEHARDNVYYYTPNPGHGGYSLRINIANVRPYHLMEITEFSAPQEDAMYLAYRTWGRNWINNVLLSEGINGVHQTTMASLQRKIMVALDLGVESKQVISMGSIFSVGNEGMSTIRDISDLLDSGKIVILDTSTMSKNLEILISSMIMSEVFNRHRRCKEGRDERCEFRELPVVSVVLEEAPRVLGGEGGNIFKTIAREGRKFKVGIIAITQLPSMIPREIMANLNTKIILGNEMKSERDAIISSAPQDLTRDSKMISSLDKGEAIVSSIFTRFAVPVKVGLFEDIVDKSRREQHQTTLADPGL